MRYLVLTGLFFRAILCGQAANDPPIRSAFKQAEPTLTRTFLLRRTQVDGSLDLVLAMASSQHLSGPIAWWGEKDKLGLFLQERSNPNRVYTLTLAPGFADCYFRILRATATDAVIQCTGEKSTQYPNQKFVYDIRAKKLIGQFSYQPFSMRRILSRSRNGALIAGTDGTRQIAVEFPTFRLLSHTEELKPAPEFQPISFGGGFRLTQETRTSMGPQPLIVDTNGKKYQLPHSNFEAFAQSRPERVRDGYKPPLEFDDHIGPYKVEGSNLWFGKSFYDGEGITGIGGFGYFDATEKKFHLYGPPEILEYSVSAIHVDADAVWMALVRNCEWGASSGGLLRFDRSSNAVSKFELPEIGVQFLRSGEALLLATQSGFAVIVNEEITRYFIDKTTDGRLKLSQQ